MKLAALISGGKDSIFSLYKAIQEGHEVKYLITVFPKREDSWMFHYPCVELTKLQARAIGKKHIMKESSGVKEKELEDLKEILKELKDDIEGIVSGAIASSYQKSRIDRICKELKLRSFSPLWHRDPEEILKEEINAGFKVIIVGVYSAGLDKTWLGRKIDKKCVEDLIKLSKIYGKTFMVFEGGEAETLVVDGPIFRKKIKILQAEKVWDEKTNSGYLKIKKAELVKKL
jgi:ABC transporter with metal-binding/Fe-S-binding domain ATP-binding protein